MTNKDIFKGTTCFSSRQNKLAGSALSNFFQIQPYGIYKRKQWTYLFSEGNVVKYVCRYQLKGKWYTRSREDNSLL